MQAIIMAAGKGERISELTGGLPKSFLKVRGRAIIDYQLDCLEGYGVSEVIIVVGYRKELFEERYNLRENIRLVFNPFYANTNVLASFWFGMPHLSGDFLYFHADTYFEKKILEMLIQQEGQIVLPVDMKPCDEETMKVVLNENKQVVKISKEISPSEAAGEFIGIAKLTRDILPAIKEKVAYFMEREEFSHYFETAIQKCIDDKVVLPEIIDVSTLFWNEIDFIEDYEKVVNGEDETDAHIKKNC